MVNKENINQTLKDYFKMSTLRSKFSNSVLGLHLIWKELPGSAMILCITMLISTFFTSPSVGIEISRTGRCNWKGHIRTLRCSHIRGGNYTGTSPDQMFNTPIIEDIDPEIVWKVESIEIRWTILPTVNMSHFGSFPALKHLSIQNCNVSQLRGTVPLSLSSLNLSHNSLSNASAFGSRVFSNASKLESLDLSHNKLEQLPIGVFELHQLKKIFLMGNELKCKWISGKKFYNWAWNTNSGNRGLIQNIDDIFCRPKQLAFDKMTILSVLKLREVAFGECVKTDCECDIWTTKAVKSTEPSPYLFNSPIHSNQYGSVYLTLRFNCSNMNLTDLPPISPYTTTISLDNNEIRNLSQLTTEKNYTHITSISLNNNKIEELESIISTPFFDRVRKFQVKSNLISRITPNIIASIFRTEGRASRIEEIAIGGNSIHCGDCNDFRKLKFSLNSHRSRIPDWEMLSCKSFPNITLHELKEETLCPTIKEEENKDWWVWIVVAIEAILIIVILTKLWRDRKEYRRNGTLPNISQRIPRLPCCDFMLERIDDSHSQHYRKTQKRLP